MQTYIFLFIAVYFSEAWGRQIASIEEWNAFKVKFNKNYHSDAEENKRYKAYNTNKMKIEEHNKLFRAGKVSYEMGINQFADMTDQQYQDLFYNYSEYYGNLTVFEDEKDDYNETEFTNINHLLPEKVVIPEAIDWRDLGAVTAVKNQANCGACWAFAIVGCLEAQYFRKTGKLISFSEQHLIDCSSDYGNNGCNGGGGTYALKYIKEIGGLDSEETYPFKEETQTCRFKKKTFSMDIKDFGMLHNNDENLLKSAVGFIGPVYTTLDSSSNPFRFYKSGILDDQKCMINDLDHAVLVVGYGTDPTGREYWIVKNSFGPLWGDNGYVKIARNKGMCGISNDSVYVLF